MAEDSVYGLYGDLLNLRDYECDSTDLGRVCQENHRSDPELDTIPYRVSTLDRRVTMKSQRPRSDIFFQFRYFSRLIFQVPGPELLVGGVPGLQPHHLLLRHLLLRLHLAQPLPQRLLRVQQAGVNILPRIRKKSFFEQKMSTKKIWEYTYL